MNKAFFSYSLNSTEEFIVTRLASDLQKEGYILESSRNMMSENVDFSTYSSITKSSLFIGVMSSNGSRWERVWKEYIIAKTHTIPALLLVEETFTNLPADDPTIMIFNRHRTGEVIERITSMLSNRAATSTPNQQNLLPLFFGGVAVLGLIALLSENGKESTKKSKKSIGKINAASSIKKLEKRV